LEETDRRHVGRASHFRLLDHPVVAELLREWLAGPAEAPRRPPRVSSAAKARLRRSRLPG
jgi:hypothetical protein